MIQSKPKIEKKLTASALIVAMLCTQLFSIVHFHHTHDADDNSQIIISAHPINSENNRHNHHDNDDHHHPEDDHIIAGWHFIKSDLFSQNKNQKFEAIFTRSIINDPISLSSLI